MDTNLSEKDKTELVKFIDDILYHDEGKGLVIVPFRGFALSEKYEELEEMENEVKLLLNKLEKISKTAIKKYEALLDENTEPMPTVGVQLDVDRDELRKIRSQLAA